MRGGAPVVCACAIAKIRQFKMRGICAPLSRSSWQRHHTWEGRTATLVGRDPGANPPSSGSLGVRHVSVVALASIERLVANQNRCSPVRFAVVNPDKSVRRAVQARLLDRRQPRGGRRTAMRQQCWGVGPGSVAGGTDRVSLLSRRILDAASLSYTASATIARASPPRATRKSLAHALLLVVRRAVAPRRSGWALSGAAARRRRRARPSPGAGEHVDHLLRVELRARQLRRVLARACSGCGAATRSASRAVLTRPLRRAGPPVGGTRLRRERRRARRRVRPRAGVPLDLLRTRIAGAVGAEASITAARRVSGRAACSALPRRRRRPAHRVRGRASASSARWPTAGRARRAPPPSASPPPRRWRRLLPQRRSAASSGGRSATPATSPRFASCSPRAARTHLPRAAALPRQVAPAVQLGPTTSSAAPPQVLGRQRRRLSRGPRPRVIHVRHEILSDRNRD